MENKKYNIKNLTNIGRDIHCTPIEPLRQTQPSIEGFFLAI